jgi:transposase
MPAAGARLDVNIEELQALVDRGRQAPLGEEGHRKLKAAVDTLGHLVRLLQEKDTSLGRLRELLFGSSTEKTSRVLNDAGVKGAGKRRKSSGEKRKGHGRHGAQAYRGARKVEVRHTSLKPGERCPECLKGKVYAHEPASLVRIVGQAPVDATVYALEALRCNLCGEVFTAAPPAGVGTEKYDATAASMIALLKYGSGVPFYRQERLQEKLGIPLPASTQWEIVAETAAALEPAMDELIRQSAQGEVLHNDDTTMKVLALVGEGTGSAEVAEAEASPPERRGVFTSGIVSTRAGEKIALFFTGRRHAGENLAGVLAHRAPELGPPIQMCDALSRNLPKLPEPLATIVAYCLAHGRRKFVEVAPNFPEDCRYVLEELSEVYAHDEQARERALSAEERLRFHQAASAPVMDRLKLWLETQFAEKKAEPNSGLGKAIAYLLKHWQRLTLFLRQAGAPLDNNICERALKKAILHRKNALFYKTEKGAAVGDLFMSLIHTCELCGANPFDYLTELQKHSRELKASPGQWMPWNYRQRLEPGETARAQAA